MQPTRTPQPHTSPWGRVQHADELAPGIWQVHTAGHGGIQLSATCYALLPLPLRANPYGGDHWFEEDCEALFVLFHFRHVIDGGKHAAKIEGHARAFAKTYDDGSKDPYAIAARWMLQRLDTTTEATRAGAQTVIPGAEKHQRPTATQLELLF